MSDELEIQYSNFKNWLQLKADDFADQGYETITTDDIWAYFINYKWKNKKPSRYHHVVHYIRQLTVNEYFNYEQLKAQVFDVKDIADYDLRELI